MKSALAPEPAFQAYELRLGPADICRHLPGSMGRIRSGAAGVLRRHGVEKTTPPLGLVLQLTAQFEPVGLPSQHGLNIFGPWGSVKNSIVAGIRVSAWRVHLVFITKHRYCVLDGDVVDRLRLLFRKVAPTPSPLTEMDGEDHHVHLVVRYPPKVAISKLNSLEGRFQSNAPAGAT